MLNTSTGRTLPRAAGGPDAVLDHFDGQTWKDRPGTPDLLAWCVRRCEVGLSDTLYWDYFGFKLYDYRAWRTSDFGTC